MAKKQTSPELTEEFKKTLEMTRILDVEVDDELKRSFIAYAMAVNKSRAIPDVRDGFKPVHRRILYSMHEMGLYNDKDYRKCARIVGDVLGKFHPHGDSSVYDALVRLAQDFSINFPLVDGHGNFGSVDGDPPAAMRYTEARLSKLAAEMLRDLDKETVDFFPNFDGNEMEPAVLTARFPNLLVNGSDGIAVGMATNIPPHNLAETIDGTVALIDNPDLTVDELMDYIPAPDFPTGGIIMGRSGIRKAYRTGQGNIIIRSKCEIEEYGSGANVSSRIVVTEIPYQVNKAMLVKTIADMVKDKRIDGISDIRDESGREGMRIVIECKKDANAQVVLNSLYKHTNLQVSDGIILLALVENGTEPKVLNLKEILVNYLAHQKEVITRRTRFDLAKAEERAHIVEGLVLALANIDEVIRIIKESADKNDAAAKLTAAFELSDKQANAILEMRLQRLTSLEVEKLKEELEAAARDHRRPKGHSRQRAPRAGHHQGRPARHQGEVSLRAQDGDLRRLRRDRGRRPHRRGGRRHLHDAFGYVKRIPVPSTARRTAAAWASRRTGPRTTTSWSRCSSARRTTTSCCSPISARCTPSRATTFPKRRARRAAARSSISSSSPRAKRSPPSCPSWAAATGYLVMATKHGLIKKTATSEFDHILRSGKIAIRITEGTSSSPCSLRAAKTRSSSRPIRASASASRRRTCVPWGAIRWACKRHHARRRGQRGGYARPARGLRHSHRLRKRLRQAYRSRRLPSADARRQGHQGGRVQRKDGRARQHEDWSPMRTTSCSSPRRAWSSVCTRRAFRTSAATRAACAS